MSKSAIVALIIVGFIFLFLGMAFNRYLFMIGLVAIIAGFVIGVGPNGVLRKEQVRDSWSTLIENAHGKAEEIFRNAEAFIKGNNVPSLVMEKKSIAPGFVKSVLGSAREFLVVIYAGNFRIKPYQLFVNARDFGNNLDVSLYMTYRPSMWQALALLTPFVGAASQALSELDLFDQQDLRAYGTIVHHAVLESVDKLMFDLKQDPSKIDRKSRGFLGIS